MKGMQNLMVLIILFGLHLFTFIWTLVMLGSLKFEKSRSFLDRLRELSWKFGPTLIAIVVMFWVLGAASDFDFIDRCRPTGTGFCNHGILKDQVRAQIFTDLMVTGWWYIILPVLLPILVGVPIMLLWAKRMPKVQADL
jgi:hypothetical protein